LTWIFSSLQTSLGFAMVGAVVGEYLGATRGLGYVIAQAEGTFDTTGVFAGMTVLGIVVVIVSAGVTRLKQWLFRWKSGGLLRSRAPLRCGWRAAARRARACATSASPWAA